MTGEAEDRLREIVGEHPDATLKVLCELLGSEAHVAVSETTIWRQLERITPKRETLRPSEQDRPDVIEAHKRLLQRMWWWHNRTLVFIDESGVNLSLTRAEGRAPRGERLIDAVPARCWENYTVIAGLREDGIIGPMMLSGAMNAECLRIWVRESLAPALKPGEIAEVIERRLKARTREALVDALGTALRVISRQDCIGWFRHAGYTLP